MQRLLAIALAFAAAFGALRGAENVVFALKPDKNPDAMMESRRELAKFLSQKLGKPAEVIVPLSSAVIIEGLANGSIDVAFLGATDMVNAADSGAAEVLLAEQIDGQPSYKSYWLTLKDKPYDSVESLKGKPVAFASKTSTSGFLIPMLDLKEKGLLGESNDPEAFFGGGNVLYGTGYVSAVEKVLNGEAEAAAVSYYVLDRDKHLTAEQRAKLKKVSEQGPVPTHVIAVSSKLSKEDAKALKEALLSMNAEKQALRDQVFTAELVEVDGPKHIEPVRKALKIVGVKS